MIKITFELRHSVQIPAITSNHKNAHMLLHHHYYMPHTILLEFISNLQAHFI